MAINPQAVRGPVTAVPVVAGKGVRLREDVENNRVVAEADETVLWSGSQELTLNAEITLSETYKNFEYICFECSRLSLKKRTTFSTYDDGSHYAVTINDSQVDASGVLLLDVATLSLSNVLKPKVLGMGRKQLNTSSVATSTGQPLTLIAVYGINRIASA